MKMNIEVLNPEMIEVVKVDDMTFDGKRFKGWALYIEGLGYMGFEENKYPYVLGGKKYAQAIKDGWGFDWNYTIVQEG